MKTNVRIKLGKRIKGLREKKGYTQEEFADLAKIDYKYLQKIEGKKPPNLKIETIERLAKTFKISLSKLVDFK